MDARSSKVPAANRLSMRRFFWLPIGLSALVVLMVLAGLVAMSWRSLDRLRPVQHHLAHIARIQDVGLNMEQTLLRSMRGAQIGASEMQALKQQIVDIASVEGALHPETNGRLTAIATRLTQTGSGSVDALFEALANVRQVLNDERARHDGLLLEVADSTRVELRLAVALLVGLPVVGGIALLLMLDRAGQPLRDLQDLLNRLGARDFHPVPEDTLNRTTKLARPAFNSYNALVSRLQDLEAEHRDRELDLERRVREATKALLAQSRELSRAERLAAVGAVSAGLAHELRNPLAGIQLACSKIHQLLDDTPQAERIQAVIGELKRINTLLTAQVDAARHAPEPSVPTNIAATVDELLGLLRYQVSDELMLAADIADDIQCMLPVAGLRQALLNLLLNAVQIQNEQGAVTISAAVEEQQQEVVVQISDEGPGFPQEMLRAGIRPFATGRSGGTGLGLAMVRRFVRDLDGELMLENRASGGATVTLRLPCRAAGGKGAESDV